MDEKNGLLSAWYNISSNLPTNRHAKLGDILVHIAVPETWRYGLSLKKKKFLVNTKEAKLTKNEVEGTFVSRILR